VLLKTILYHFITTTFQKKKRIHGCFFYVNLQQGAAVPIKLWPGLLLKKKHLLQVLTNWILQKTFSSEDQIPVDFSPLAHLVGSWGCFL